MSVATVRGGVPAIFTAAIDSTTGRTHTLPHVAMHLKIRVTGNPCKLYFTAADWQADKNFVTVPIPSAATPNGEWEGPCEVGDVWLKGLGGVSNVELVTFQRRG